MQDLMKPIPYGRQFIDKSDVNAAASIMASDWITQGPSVREFEEALAYLCKARYAVAVSSGTAALHIACLAAGLKKGDEAVTTPITFLATANSVLYAGANPVFADIEPSTILIDPLAVRKAVSMRTKAILPVHFAGLPCDMPALHSIAARCGAVIVEDACHALGAEYRDKNSWHKVGSCTHSEMTAFSFHPVKHITTGEGGAITTNDAKLYKRLTSLRNHGIYKDKKTVSKGQWYYEMRELGFNYRLTDFQCGLGISQLRKVRGFIKRRREIASIYDAAFSGLRHVSLPETPAGRKHSYHLYIIQVDFKALRTTRQKFIDYLKGRGVLTQVHYIPLYRQPYYRKRLSIDARDFPNSERYYERALSIPMFPSIRDKDVKTVIKAVKELSA